MRACVCVHACVHVNANTYYELRLDRRHALVVLIYVCLHMIMHLCAYMYNYDSSKQNATPVGLLGSSIMPTAITTTFAIINNNTYSDSLHQLFLGGPLKLILNGHLTRPFNVDNFVDNLTCQ